MSREHHKLECIRRIVVDYLHQPYYVLDSKCRRSGMVYARHLAIYMCCRHTRLTLNQIGAEFRGINHSSVIRARTAIEDRIDTEPEVRRDADRLNAMIESALNPHIILPSRINDMDPFYGTQYVTQAA